MVGGGNGTRVFGDNINGINNVMNTSNAFTFSNPQQQQHSIKPFNNICQ